MLRPMRLVPGLAALFAALGCASFQPLNAPLGSVDFQEGYRPSLAGQHRERGSLSILLAFSGGGTRAAAFAYGVLEALRDTEVVVDGRRVRLLDEVDTLSGVSGGSFPAAYYGLYGDRIFEDFEQRFLKRNVQRALVLQTLNPVNLVRLLSPNTSRSVLAARYYDRVIFDGATFADLTRARGPSVYINATDLSHGYRFTFTQGTFDVICSDLDPFHVSLAVAASSAVPGLLSPITLVNRAGSCSWQPPAWLMEADRSRQSEPRRYRAARSLLDYRDAKRRPYIHLVDGGISDNLGLRASLDLRAAVGSARDMLDFFGEGRPEHVIVIAVNAETDPPAGIDVTPSSPSLALLMNAVSGAQIRRYNFETLVLARDEVERFAAELSRPGRPVGGHFIEVSFDLIEDEEERRHFKELPTSFSLTDQQIDDLQAVARRLLEASPAYQGLLARLR